MITYFKIIQKQLKTKRFYNPIKTIKIPYTTKKILVRNTNYWNEIQNQEFSYEFVKSDTACDAVVKGLPVSRAKSSSNIFVKNYSEIKNLYLMFIENIANNIKNNPIQIKYKAYKQLITNIFLTQEIKKQIQTIFETTQKHYFVLTRFSRHIKNIQQKTKPPNYKITNDLSMTTLNPNDKYTFIVYEYTNAYLFSIQ